KVLDLIAGRQQRTELREIATHVAVAGQSQGEDMGVLVEGDLNHHVLRAAMMIGYATARALVGPFHRTPEKAGGVQDADIFRIDRSLHAERAADLAGPNADLVGGGAGKNHTWTLLVGRADMLQQGSFHAVNALAR